MKVLKKLVDTYARVVSKHSVIVLLLVIFILLIAFQQAKNVHTKSMDYKDMLPDDLEVMKAMDLLNDNFGGSDSAMFAIELDSENNESKIDDIRDPEVIRYIYLLGELALHTDDVVSVTSGATLLKQMNGNHLPKSLNRVKELEKRNLMLKSYLSDDHTLALIKIKLSDEKWNIYKRIPELLDVWFDSGSMPYSLSRLLARRNYNLSSIDFFKKMNKLVKEVEEKWISYDYRKFIL